MTNHELIETCHDVVEHQVNKLKKELKQLELLKDTLGATPLDCWYQLVKISEIIKKFDSTVDIAIDYVNDKKLGGRWSR